MDKLIYEISRWGAKKEYPNYVSFLIAILLPVIGLIFVSNQKDIKNFRYGKQTRLMSVAISISVIYWLIFLGILFIFC